MRPQPSASCAMIEVNCEIQRVMAHEHPSRRIPQPRSVGEMHPKTQPLVRVTDHTVDDLDVAWHEAELTWLAWRSLGVNVCARRASLEPIRAGLARSRWKRVGDNRLGRSQVRGSCCPGRQEPKDPRVLHPEPHDVVKMSPPHVYI